MPCDPGSRGFGRCSAEWAGKNDHLLATTMRPTSTKIAMRFMKTLSFGKMTVVLQTHSFGNRELPNECVEHDYIIRVLCRVARNIADCFPINVFIGYSTASNGLAANNRH